MRPIALEKRNDDVKAREPAPPRGRILIVDDEAVIAATLKEFLQGEGFEVATAGDLPSALAQVQAFEPEIVLCDVQLPGGDGITVLNRALQIRPEIL
ncbi:MAG TPA: response regulator, partial [Isosphaeraceae bacterium]|nr:response regulator [Isosphaeraceae bacterium]